MFGIQQQSFNMEYEVRLDIDPKQEYLNRLHKGIKEFGLEKGVFASQKFAFFVRGKDQAILAGCSGWMKAGCPSTFCGSINLCVARAMV